MAHTAFKYRLNPTKEQEKTLLKFCNASKEAFNLALIWQEEAKKSGEKFISCFSLYKKLTEYKKISPSFEGVPVIVVRSGLKNCADAIENYKSKRSKFPKFKDDKSKLSFSIPDSSAFSINETNSIIKLRGIDSIKYINSRQIQGRIISATVSFYLGFWYISIVTEINYQTQNCENTRSVGIDIGITRFITLSDGRYFNKNYNYTKLTNKIKKEEQILKTKSIGSKNYEKQNLKVLKARNKLVNCRKDFLHKLTDKISKEYGIVCIEDLSINRLVQIERDSPYFRKSMNEAFYDSSFYEFRQQLEYKLKRTGGKLVVVNPAYTSITCPKCCFISKENRSSQAVFKCVKCSFIENADFVASINIHNLGVGTTHMTQR